MKKRLNDSARAMALLSSMSIALVSGFAILLAIAAPTNSKTTPEQSPRPIQPASVPLPFLGNYPNTSIPLSTNTTVTPDAAPTNTTSINVSTSTNFKGKLEGNPTTGVVRVTDAHPAGTTR